jgi:hypothetical protein
MFNRAIRGHTPPTYLSSDHDRLFQCHRWQANLRILDIEEMVLPGTPWVTEETRVTREAACGAAVERAPTRRSVEFVHAC